MSGQTGIICPAATGAHRNVEPSRTIGVDVELAASDAIPARFATKPGDRTAGGTDESGSTVSGSATRFAVGRGTTGDRCAGEAPGSTPPDRAATTATQASAVTGCTLDFPFIPPSHGSKVVLASCYVFPVLERLWIGWLVIVLGLSLAARFVPAAKVLDKPRAYVFWAGLTAYIVWATDGRLAVFAAIGSVMALASLILLAMSRARPANLARLPVVAKTFLRPALAFGAVIGAGIEVGGRWSGRQFAVWPGVIGGVAVLFVGLILMGRTNCR